MKKISRTVIRWSLWIGMISMSLLLFAACGVGDEQEALKNSEADPYVDVPENDYETASFYTEEGRIYYEDALTGIDVSSHQGTIDWEAVADDGIDFAYIRCGYRGYSEGGIEADERFEENIEKAQDAHIKIGAYFFSQATDVEEAQEEAEFVIEQLRGIPLDLPVTFDMEDLGVEDSRIAGLTMEEKTAIALAFCETLEKGGYTPMIYGNIQWLTQSVDLNQISEEKIWLAQYNEVPTFAYDFELWQYSNTGTVEGISGSVDLDLLFDCPLFFW